MILDSSAWHVTPQLEENGLMCVEGCYEPVSMVYKGLYSPTPMAFYAGTHEEAADAMETQRREPWSISASLLKCFARFYVNFSLPTKFELLFGMAEIAQGSEEVEEACLLRKSTYIFE